MKYSDSMGATGELELADVRAGDTVRAARTIERVSAGPKHPDAVQTVKSGELGEVIDVMENEQTLLVRLPAQTRALGSVINGEADLLVEPLDVIVLIDVRDPRASSYRVEDIATADDVDQAELAEVLRDYGTVAKISRRVALGEALRRGHRDVAAAVARSSEEGFAAYVRRHTATASDWLPLILWAGQAAGPKFRGRGRFDLTNKQHTIWALEQLSQQLDAQVPVDSSRWEKEDEETVDIIDDLMELKRVVVDMSPAQWAEMLPRLGGSEPDRELKQKYVDFANGVGPIPVPPKPQLQAPKPAPAPAPTLVLEEGPTDAVLRSFQNDEAALARELFPEEPRGPAPSTDPSAWVDYPPDALDDYFRQAPERTDPFPSNTGTTDQLPPLSEGEEPASRLPIVGPALPGDRQSRMVWVEPGFRVSLKGSYGQVTGEIVRLHGVSATVRTPQGLIVAPTTQLRISEEDAPFAEELTTEEVKKWRADLKSRQRRLKARSAA